MKASILLKKFFVFVVFIGLPIVDGYHKLSGSVFFNMEIEGAKSLEKFANQLLVPTRYLLAGRKVTFKRDYEGKEYADVRQKYDYDKHFKARTISSVMALPISAIGGSLLKGMAFIDKSVRHRHFKARRLMLSSIVRSNNAYYESLGIDTRSYLKGEVADCQGYKRNPGDSENMSADQRALKDIIQVLSDNNIIFWIDCGTCLGAYRYGGVIPWDFDVDIAILQPDFDNVKYALKQLNPSKYVVQDWSGRSLPDTYLKIYVKESHTLIDVYHFQLHPDEKIITSIVSNEHSIFLPEKWKWRERRYKVPTPFSTVFPLKKAHFDGLVVPVPNKTKQYLQLRYGENLDPCWLYNEESGKYEKDITHPYWELEYAH